MWKTIIEPVRAGRCLAPLVIYAPGEKHEALTICGLIDTSAPQSAIDPRIAQILRLPRMRPQTLAPATGDQVGYPIQSATIEFWLQGFGADGVGGTFDLATLLTPAAGISMLVGVDILKAGDFGLHASGIWDFTF